MAKTHYETLGVAQDASDDDIRKAFRRQAAECHPDKHPGDASMEARFKEINGAYQVLGDRGKRAEYDASFRNPFQGQGGSPFGSHGARGEVNLNDLFGGMMGGQWAEVLKQAQADAAARRAQRSQPRPPESTDRGDDIVMDLKLTLAEAVYGCKKKVRARSPRPAAPCGACTGTGAEPGTRRMTCSSCGGAGRAINFNSLGTRASTCPTCRGKGSIAITPCKECSGQGKMIHEAEIVVTVPIGIDDGQQLRLAGRGSPGAPPGDLYLNVSVVKHETYVRAGRDIHAELKVPLVAALKGGHCKFAALDGTEGLIEVPAGTQSGTTLVIRGGGVPAPLTGVAGNLYVQVQIQIPEGLTGRAKKLLDELSDELPQA